MQKLEAQYYIVHPKKLLFILEQINISGIYIKTEGKHL
jgi:hypothetical protein